MTIESIMTIEIRSSSKSNVESESITFILKLCYKNVINSAPFRSLACLPELSTNL